MQKIQEKYNEWMYSIIFGKDYTSRNYNLAVLEALNNVPFEYSMDLDANRQKDAQDLRYIFGQENDIHPAEICASLDTRAPSILEVMVSLIYRVKTTILCDFDSSEMPSNKEIFEHMIWSLGLSRYVGNCDFSTNVLNAEVARVSQSLFARDYNYNGRGGLFTVENPRDDMRVTDIWYQFMWYLDGKIGRRYL